eukprot:jgi/Mesvir1/27135/Mv20806-RA.1
MELPARCGRQTCIVNLFLTIALTLVLSADAVPNLVGWLQGKEVEKREPRPEWSTPSPIHSRGLGVVDPTRLEILSWKPRLEVYHGFLSSEECDHLVDMGKRRLMRSGVVDTNTGKSALSDIRTSSGTFLAKAQDGIVEAIEHRIAVWSHVPMENGEGIQLLRYQKGEKYDPHFDYFHHEGADHNGGNRLATVLMYLSDVEEGGETVFPNTEVPKGRTGQWSDCAQAGLAYKPVKGDAILFWSLTPYGDLDRYSMHGSCPVIVGEKWSATKCLADALAHENAAAAAAASPSGPVDSGDTSRALVATQQPPGLNASPSASPDPKRTRPADKTGWSRPSEPRFRPHPFKVDDHDWNNLSPYDAMDCIFYGDYASLYDLCLHLYDQGRLIGSNGCRWQTHGALLGCPRPQLQHTILNSLLERSDDEIWAPSISAPTLRSILTEAFQQHVTPLAADVAAMGGTLAAELPHISAAAASTSTAISASTADIKAQLLDLDQRLQATANALESLHDTAGLTAQAVKDIAAQPASAGPAGDAPSTWADLLKQHTTSTTSTISAQLKQQALDLREETDIARRSHNVIVKHFDQPAGETSTTLLEAFKRDILAPMLLTGELDMSAVRLPRARGKAGPAPVLLTFKYMADKLSFLKCRKKLSRTRFTLDDDLTLAQQQRRRELWPAYLQLRHSAGGKPVYWRGAVIHVDHKPWQPPPATPD